MRITAVRSCRYADADGTAIDCTIAVEVAPGATEDWPFTASAADSAAHGREIFARATAGEFGPVAPFVPPPAPPPPRPPTLAAVQAELTQLQARIDALAAAAVD